MLICCYEQKSTVPPRAHRGGAHSVGLDKRTVTCVHHYSIMQGGVPALESPGPGLFMSLPNADFLLCPYSVLTLAGICPSRRVP